MITERCIGLVRYLRQDFVHILIHQDVISMLETVAEVVTYGVKQELGTGGACALGAVRIVMVGA